MSQWTPPSAGEIRLTLVGSVLAGLIVAGISSAWPIAPSEVEFAGVSVPDYWAESKRSRRLLAPQEASAGVRAVAEVAGPEATITAAVAIVDGDTFRVGGDTIRVADIDTPEMRGRCPYETELAARATRRMDELLQAGPFELEPVERDTDRYGRKLRVVTRNGRSLGDMLVAEGLARTWSGRREPWCV